MIKNKLITSIFFVVFFVIFSILNWKQYFDFHKEKQDIINNNIQISKQIELFSLDKINEIKETEIYYTPNKSLLDDIVNKINEAKKNVFIEVYMLTEKRIQTAIKNAWKRWVETKIILEKDPYMAYSMNDKAFKNLKNWWINVVWSNDKNYTLNHTKMLLIDDLSIISTWNLTYSTFTTNKDFFVLSYDKELNKNLKELFFLDFKWKKTWFYTENLILSPDYSRHKLETMLLSAKKDIKIYAQYFKDESINNLLVELKNKNINIEIVTAKTAMEDEQTIKLIKSWINIKQIPKYKMHSKAILIDETYLFLWSVNFSSYSFDQNREVWILIKNEKIINDFIEIFKKDFN